jgi:hypothetical protein
VARRRTKKLAMYDAAAMRRITGCEVSLILLVCEAELSDSAAGAGTLGHA